MCGGGRGGGGCGKWGGKICLLDSSQNSLTGGVVAGSSQNQCQELLPLVEIVNLLL